MRRYNRKQSEAPLAGDENLRFQNPGIVNIGPACARANFCC